jgi:hypothetical protein
MTKIDAQGQGIDVRCRSWGKRIGDWRCASACKGETRIWLAQIATLVGILAFWLLLFTVGLAPVKPPACYFAFEHIFALPDCVLALGLLAAGTLLLRGRAWGQVLPLPCAGLISLGLVGVGFNLANGVYTSSLADGCLMAGAINLWCVALGLALTVAVGPSMQTVGNIQPT